MKTKTATEHQQVPAGETVTWNKKNDPPKTGTVIAFVKPGEDAHRVIDRYLEGSGPPFPRARFKERRSRLPRYLIHVTGERPGMYAPSAGMIEDAWREARVRAAFREASPPLPVGDAPAAAHFEYVDPPLPFDALPLFAASGHGEGVAVVLPTLAPDAFAAEVRRLRRLRSVGASVDHSIDYLAYSADDEQWAMVEAVLSSPPAVLREAA